MKYPTKTIIVDTPDAVTSRPESGGEVVKGLYLYKKDGRIKLRLVTDNRKVDVDITDIVTIV